MHNYLSAIGLSSIEKRSSLEELIQKVISDPTEKNFTSYKKNSILVEFKKNFTESLGLLVCGEYDEENKFHYNYFHPYMEGTGITSTEDIVIERHADKESYAGVCDDVKVGVSLIFYLQNTVEYLKEMNLGNLPKQNTSVTMSALSTQGTILLPINKNDVQIKNDKKASSNRNHLIEAAREGDEDAIESLTLEDIDTYTMLSRKIQNEDVFSLVDTYFMPYGIECDKYSVMGVIQDFTVEINSITKEEVYILTVDTNELIYDIGINKKDLYGEPAIGRRFKGIIWLQGYVNFAQAEE